MILVLLLAALLVSQAPSAPSRELSANLPVQATLAGGERAMYSIAVPANYAARVIVQQQGIDVGVMVKRRDATTPEHGLDFVAGPTGEERQYPLVLDVAATWDIRISAQLPKAARANYTITVEVVPADDRDRKLAAAHAMHYEASELAWKTDYRRAYPLYASAAEAALALGDLSIAAESTYQVARMHDQFGETPAAIERQLRALELFRTIGQLDHQGRVLNRLGDLSRKIGEVADAERYFEEALPLAKQSQDLANIADVTNNSGLLLLVTGRPEEAIARLESGLPLAREVNSATVEASLLLNSAEAYRRLGMYDRAIETMGQAKPVYARLNLPRRTARMYHALSGAFFEAGRPADAEEAMRQSLDYYGRSDDQLGYAEALGFSARMSFVSGDSDRALAQFEQARPLLQQAKSRLGEASLLASWAEMDIAHADYAAALDKLPAAIALSRAVNNPYTETRSHYLRAVALQRDGRLNDALTAIELVIERVEAMRGSIARSDLRTSYLATVRSYYDLYVDLLQQRGDAAAAFEVSERARARALLEGLAESAAKIEKGADPALLAKQRAVQRELNAKEAYRVEVASRDGDNSALARAAAANVEKLLDQWTAIRAQVRAASPAYAALQQPQPIALTQLRGLLDARTAMVAYHLGKDRGYVWVIDRETITVATLPGMDAIDSVARRYHEALSRELDTVTATERDGALAASTAAGRELATLVWKPIEASVKGRRLLIVADRALHYVPFAALPTSTGAPVLATHEVVYLPSASVLASLRVGSKRVTLNASTAVFADPVFSKSDPRFAAARVAPTSQSRGADDNVYGRLRFSRREAEAIGERVPGAFQALDFAATKSAVTSRDLRKYTVLHFATHGSLNTEHPELSGLVLSLFDKSGKPIDGFLRLHEIYNLDLNADLVVLSACSTALGREVHGEGLIGLTRGFMYAGASRVVSSIWNVDDRASALLMSRFYDAMRTKQLAPAAALRDAQLSLMNDPRWSNPHYWAAFGLQGEWK